MVKRGLVEAPKSKEKIKIGGWTMRWIKMTLSAGLAIFLSIWIGGGFSESKAQSNQVLELTKPQLRNRIQASGFITAKPLSPWGSIIATKDAAVNLTEGETVYLLIERGKEVQPGDRFSIVHWGRAVTHPLTNQEIGHLVTVVGELIILGGKDQFVAAKINKSYRPILQGDMIILPPPVLPQRIPIRSQERIEGIVLLDEEDAENISEKEIVFIDRGNRDGVIMGDHFSIYHKGVYEENQEREDNRFPLPKVGEAVVVDVQEETSTALVTHSSQSIYIGDLMVSGKE
jgi:hypothetical protein